MVGTFRGRWVRALLISLLTAAGCGGGGVKVVQPVSLDDLINRLVVAVCKYEVACNDVPDMATCLATTLIDPNYVATIKQDIASGKVMYDTATAGVCADLIDRLYAAACNRTALAAIPDRDSPVCNQVFTGTVPIGGTCFFSEECADGGTCPTADLTCSRSLQCCPGTCTAKTLTVPVGGSCSSGDVCASGSYCDTSVSGVAGTCKLPTAGEGAACSDTIPCATPLYCDSDPVTGMQTCHRPAATGGACSTAFIYSSCDDGRDYCDQVTATCVRKLGIGVTCATGQECVGYAACLGSICVAQPGPGQACDPTNGPSCLGAVTCDAATSICTAPPVGGACM